MDTLLFTPASLIELLSKIEELSDYNIGLTQTLDGDIQLTVGDSVYEIDADDATDVVADAATVDTVEEINIQAYEELEAGVSADVSVDDDEYVSSGIIKEIAKTLLLGGMVRLSKKLLER